MALVYAPASDLLTCNMSTPLLSCFLLSFSLFPLSNFILTPSPRTRFLHSRKFQEWLLACPSCRPSWSALDADDFHRSTNHCLRLFVPTRRSTRCDCIRLAQVLGTSISRNVTAEIHSIPHLVFDCYSGIWSLCPARLGPIHDRLIRYLEANPKRSLS
jgi:hypothetical protein